MKEYVKLETEYISQAKEDIKNDNVTYKYAGGLTISECDSKIENKIDSINKNYGVRYFNTGCIIMEQNIKAQEKYAEIVKPYLEKRNGKDWEQKMKNEIETIIFEDGRPYIEGSVNDIVAVIVNSFEDKGGLPLSPQTIRTILKPSKEDKRPNSEKRIDLGEI